MDQTEYTRKPWLSFGHQLQRSHITLVSSLIILWWKNLLLYETKTFIVNIALLLTCSVFLVNMLAMHYASEKDPFLGEWSRIYLRCVASGRTLCQNSNLVKMEDTAFLRHCAPVSLSIISISGQTLLYPIYIFAYATQSWSEAKFSELLFDLKEEAMFNRFF